MHMSLGAPATVARDGGQGDAALAPGQPQALPLRYARLGGVGPARRAGGGSPRFRSASKALEEHILLSLPGESTSKWAKGDSVAAPAATTLRERAGARRRLDAGSTHSWPHTVAASQATNPQSERSRSYL